MAAEAAPTTAQAPGAATTTTTTTNASTDPRPPAAPMAAAAEKFLSISPSTAAALEPYLPPLASVHPSIGSSSSSSGEHGGGGAAAGLREAASSSATAAGRPFVTLTFATSLDSALSLAPGVRTSLSGPASKAMTHHLRARHDAIVVGVGTAVADDPGLNCRSDPASLGAGGGVVVGGGKEEGGISGGAGARLLLLPFLAPQPRPVVLDPSARWMHTPRSKTFALAREGRGRGPWIFVDAGAGAGAGGGALGSVVDEARLANVESAGGMYVAVKDMVLRDGGGGGSSGGGAGEEEEGGGGGGSDSARFRRRFNWPAVLGKLWELGVRSAMVEGGGAVINSLLARPAAAGGSSDRGSDGGSGGFGGCFVDSVIVTVAPVWLGRGGVVVSPPRDEDREDREVARLRDVRWVPLGEDVVLCGRLGYEE